MRIVCGLDYPLYYSLIKSAISIPVGICEMEEAAVEEAFSRPAEKMFVTEQNQR